MRKEQYKSKARETLYRPVLSLKYAQHLQFDDEMVGFCLACGDDVTGIEPDARKYHCENCGREKVYGIEELILMGIAKIA